MSTVMQCKSWHRVAAIRKPNPKQKPASAARRPRGTGSELQRCLRPGSGAGGQLRKFPGLPVHTTACSMFINHGCLVLDYFVLHSFEGWDNGGVYEQQDATSLLFIVGQFIYSSSK